jgi:hypothetical protein
MINVIGSTPQPNQPLPPEPSGEVPEQAPQMTAPTGDGVPESSSQQQASQPPKKKGGLSRKNLIAGIALLLLIVGGGVGLYLVKLNQDLRQQAKVEIPSDTGTTTTESDPNRGPEPECRTNRDCSGGRICLNNTCEVKPAPVPQTSEISGTASEGESCQRNSECVSGLLCTNGACELGFGGETTTQTEGAATTTGTSTGGTSTSTSGCSPTHSAATCQGGKDPGDTCGAQGGGICRALTNQLDSDEIPKCTCDGGTTQLAQADTSDDGEEDSGGGDDDGETAGVGGGGDTSGDTNDDGSTTTADSGTGEEQPTLPSTLPQTGPEDWLKYLQVGLGVLGIGALLLLFL